VDERSYVDGGVTPRVNPMRVRVREDPVRDGLLEGDVKVAEGART
jgi:hypothetical protein